MILSGSDYATRRSSGVSEKYVLAEYGKGKYQ
jgi:hypothetical protein